VATISPTAAPALSLMGTSAWSPPRITTGRPRPLPSASRRRPHHAPVGSRMQTRAFSRISCSTSVHES
jgi:hypothetical protein